MQQNEIASSCTFHLKKVSLLHCSSEAEPELWPLQDTGFMADIQIVPQELCLAHRPSWLALYKCTAKRRPCPVVRSVPQLQTNRLPH